MAVVFRILLVAVALLFAGFVVAYPAWAKDEPKYVGDFSNPTTR